MNALNDQLAKLHVLSLAPLDDPNLLGSYARAFRGMGCRISSYSLTDAIQRHARLGRIGRRAASFFPIESWIRKGNKELLLHLLELKPDVVLVPASLPVLAGCLAQLKASMPDCRAVLIWPDTLLNLAPHTVQCLPLYELVASYSRAAVPVLQKLGAREIEWVPFAADPFLFPKDVKIDATENERFDCEVCFVGNWRPERERAILSLVSAGVTVKVWSHPYWLKLCSDRRQAERYLRQGPIFGRELAKAFRGAKISLNTIDATNYPAANMRFFEGPACGAATLNSPCPEMATGFPEGEAAFYYHHDDELVPTVRRLLRDDTHRLRVARAAQDLVLKEHTYQHRAELILRRLSLA